MLTQEKTQRTNQIILDFINIKQNQIQYLENYELLNNFLIGNLNKLNIFPENQIKKIFFKEKEIEKIKIIYLLPNGHFNILTNKSDKTLSLDLLIFTLNEDDKLSNLKICKEFESNICNFFGWENIVTDLNINNRFGHSVSDNNEGKINILKNVKLLKRFVINNIDYRIYESNTLGKILFQNDELKYSSKLLDLIEDYFKEFDIDSLEKKVEFFADYFPILKNLKKLNFFEKDFSLFETKNNTDSNTNTNKDVLNQNPVNIFSLNFDFIFNLILLLIIENFNVEKKEIKFYFIENDLNFLDVLKNNFPEFKEFVEVLGKEKNFEIFSLKKFKENFVSLNKTDILFSNPSEEFNEDL